MTTKSAHPVRFVKYGRQEDGKASYHVYHGNTFMHTIRFFSKKSAVMTGAPRGDAHWAVLWKNGQVGRFDTLAEAKSACVAEVA